MKFLIFTLLIIISTPVLAGDNPNERPFWGAFSGVANFMPAAECDAISGIQTIALTDGRMTHLGKSEFSTSHCPTEDGMYALLGEATMVAANGDELSFTYTAETVAPPLSIIQEIDMVITGGTGRFDGASGELSGHVYIDFLGMTTPDWPLKFVLSGYIVY